MLKGNKDIASGLISGAIVKAVKVSFEGDHNVDWSAEANAAFLSGIIVLSNTLANSLLTTFKNSDMVSNRGFGVEGSLATGSTIKLVVDEFTKWFQDKYGHEWLYKRTVLLKKLLGQEIRFLNNKWKKRKLGSMKYD